MQAVKITTNVGPGGLIKVPARQFAPGASVEVTLLNEPPVSPKEERHSFLRLARKLSIDGPPDWSANVDKYLYGPGDSEE